MHRRCSGHCLARAISFWCPVTAQRRHNKSEDNALTLARACRPRETIQIPKGAARSASILSSDPQRARTARSMCTATERGRGSINGKPACPALPCVAPVLTRMLGARCGARTGGRLREGAAGARARAGAAAVAARCGAAGRRRPGAGRPGQVGCLMQHDLGFMDTLIIGYLLCWVCTVSVQPHTHSAAVSPPMAALSDGGSQAQGILAR